jgi:hypothetical protein
VSPTSTILSWPRSQRHPSVAGITLTESTPIPRRAARPGISATPHESGPSSAPMEPSLTRRSSPAFGGWTLTATQLKSYTVRTRTSTSLRQKARIRGSSSLYRHREGLLLHQHLQDPRPHNSLEGRSHPHLPRRQGGPSQLLPLLHQGDLSKMLPLLQQGDLSQQHLHQKGHSLLLLSQLQGDHSQLLQLLLHGALSQLHLHQEDLSQHQEDQHQDLPLQLLPGQHQEGRSLKCQNQLPEDHSQQHRLLAGPYQDQRQEGLMPCRQGHCLGLQLRLGLLQEGPIPCPQGQYLGPQLQHPLGQLQHGPILCQQGQHQDRNQPGLLKEGLLPSLQGQKQGPHRRNSKLVLTVTSILNHQRSFSLRLRGSVPPPRRGPLQPVLHPFL